MIPNISAVTTWLLLACFQSDLLLFDQDIPPSYRRARQARQWECCVHLCVWVLCDNPVCHSFLFANWQSARGQVGGQQKASKKKTLAPLWKINLLPRIEHTHTPLLLVYPEGQKCVGLGGLSSIVDADVDARTCVTGVELHPENIAYS